MLNLTFQAGYGVVQVSAFCSTISALCSFTKIIVIRVTFFSVSRYLAAAPSLIDINTSLSSIAFVWYGSLVLFVVFGKNWPFIFVCLSVAAEHASYIFRPLSFTAKKKQVLLSCSECQVPSIMISV
jgi:hypothetical protein